MCDGPSRETPHHKQHLFSRLSSPAKQRGMRNQEPPGWWPFMGLIPSQVVIQM